MSTPDNDHMDLLLRLVNQLPPGVTTARKIWDQIFVPKREVDPDGFVITYAPTEDEMRAANAEFESRLSSLPPEVREFIGPLKADAAPDRISVDATRKYDQLVESLDILVLLASFNHQGLEELRAHERPMNEENLERLWHDRNWLDIVLSRPIRPLVIENAGGDIVWSPPIILQAMQKRRGALRIRQCNICSKFFWAGRIDQVACGPPRPCANRLRYRRYYEINLKSERKRKNMSGKDQAGQRNKRKRG